MWARTRGVNKMWSGAQMGSCKQVGNLNIFLAVLQAIATLSQRIAIWSTPFCCYIAYVSREFKKYWAQRRIAVHAAGYLCFRAHDGSVQWFCLLFLYSPPYSKINTHHAPGCVFKVWNRKYFWTVILVQNIFHTKYSKILVNEKRLITSTYVCTL